MSKIPKAEAVTEEEAEGILSRLRSGEYTPADIERIEKIFRAIRWIGAELEKKKASLKRIRRFFGSQTEKAKNVFKEKKCSPSQQEPSDSPQGDSSSSSAPIPTDHPDPTETSGPVDSQESGASPEPSQGVQNGKNHGRHSASAYEGAERVTCSHPDLEAKCPCPDNSCKGRLYPAPEREYLVITGQPPLKATIYEQERLRCNLCKKTYTAPLPEDTPQEKWDPSACAMSALLRYGFGFPHHRQETLQRAMGLPLADATLYDKSELCADAGLGVYRELLSLAADADLIHVDDTKARIQEFHGGKGRAEGDGRTGIHCTAKIAQTGDHEISLFTTGFNHAGENMRDLLRKRSDGLDPPQQMSDALAANIPKDFEVILLHCLTHARRNFVDIAGDYPDECEHVIDELAKVYKNDELARTMSPAERLSFHQEVSRPIMENLRKWCRSKIDNKHIEPNSEFGGAVRYLEKHWEQLTGFLRIEGAPIANDVVERLIKTFVRHRKNSLQYRTAHGARVGDIIMSLAQTAIRCGADPFHYLTSLLRHKSEARAHPKSWLPWNYQDRVDG